jgi:hypothetical protein
VKLAHIVKPSISSQIAVRSCHDYPLTSIISPNQWLNEVEIQLNEFNSSQINSEKCTNKNATGELSNLASYIGGHMHQY